MKLKGPSWDNISVEAKSFVQALLQMVPSRRPTAADALHKMPWLKQYQDYKPQEPMPAQSDQYAQKVQLKRDAQVLLAQEVDEDTIVQLKQIIQQRYDPRQQDQITIAQFREALQHTTQLSSGQLESLFASDLVDTKTTTNSSSDDDKANQVMISYVGMLNDALDRKMRKQEELIANIFSQCGDGETCHLSKAQLMSSLAQYDDKSGDGKMAHALERILDDLAPDSSTTNAAAASDATISCQQVIDRLRQLEMERVGIIRSCRDDGNSKSTKENTEVCCNPSNTNGSDSQANGVHDKDDGEEEATLHVDDLVDETNAVIPGGRRPDPNAPEPLFIYDDVSKSIRKYRRELDLSESVISL